MTRLLFILLILVAACGTSQVAVAQGGETAAAESNWPEYPTDPSNPHQFDRGPGGYFSLFKLLLIWLVFVAWVRTTDWINRDCRQVGMPQLIWNPVMVGSFLFGFFFFALSIPWFILGFPLYAACFAVPLGIYVVHRNDLVEEESKVFTQDHFRRIFARRAQAVGVKVAAPKRLDQELGPELQFRAARGADSQDVQANLVRARQSSMFPHIKRLTADAVSRRAERVMLDVTQSGTTVRYRIDSVWQDAQAYDYDNGRKIAAVIKLMSGLDIRDSQSQQSGQIGVKYDAYDEDCRVTSAGTEQGERVVVTLTWPSAAFKSLEELGMRKKMAETLIELMKQQSGFVLFSSPPGGGLSTTVATALKSVDRFTRDFVMLQPPGLQEPEVENVQSAEYDPADEEGAGPVLDRLVREEVDAFIAPQLGDGQTAARLCQLSSEHLVIGSIHAKEATEALLRVLLLKVPPDLWAGSVTAVVCQRFVRRLCDACKVAYTPRPELLSKLGLPAERVKALYQPPARPQVVATDEGPPPVCPACDGVGYRGKTAIFELLTVDEKVRDALRRRLPLDKLRQVAAAAGHRGIRDEGILQAVRGLTSLQELQRALKQ